MLLNSNLNNSKIAADFISNISLQTLLDLFNMIVFSFINFK